MFLILVYQDCYYVLIRTRMSHRNVLEEPLMV